MTEYTTLADGKTHEIAETRHSSYHGHYVVTACGCHIRERQENVDVYMTDEHPEVNDDYCSNCDHSGN